MASIFRIDMLPAKDGDCLWIEYGSEDRPYRVLIDGGRSATYDVLKRRFEDLPESQRQFELGILTHVDADHIEGFLQLLKDSDRPISFKDFWFNGYHHLEMEDAEDLEDDDELEEFGGVQGDELSDALLTHEWPWNMAFGGKTVVVPDEGDLSTVELEGGMRLTLLAQLGLDSPRCAGNGRRRSRRPDWCPVHTCRKKRNSRRKWKRLDCSTKMRWTAWLHSPSKVTRPKRTGRALLCWLSMEGNGSYSRAMRRPTILSRRLIES